MASKVYDYVTERILAALEAGRVPWHQPWRAEVGAPRNALSGKPYRGINAILTSLAGYADPRWVTLHQANQLGGKVRKGEHGTMVVFWKHDLVRKTVDEDTDEEREVLEERTILRYYLVWNVEQCDGLELKPLATPERHNDPIVAAEAVLEGYATKPPITWGGTSRAFYRPATDDIHLPARDAFDSPEEVYSTAFHEAVHSTGHPDRLHRFEVNDPLDHFGSERYGREELVAEIGGAFLCAETGIEHVIDNQAAYVAGWAERIRVDKAAVVIAAGRAQKAADYILGRSASQEEVKAA